MTGIVAGPVPAEALAWFKAKDLRIGFDHRDVWREEHASAFTVAKAMELDLLSDIRDEVGRGLAEGRTFREFADTLMPRLQARGWWGRQDMEDPRTGELKTVELGSPSRLRKIYETNLRTAYAAGQWQRIWRNRQTHPYLLYSLGPSREHRADHMRLEGVVLPVESPFWQTYFPPNGWGCKCRVTPVSKVRYARLQQEGMPVREGGQRPVQLAPPPIADREYVNRRTGEVLRIPEGIDPGWDYNPGQVARDVHMARVLGAKLQSAPVAVGSALMQLSVGFIKTALAQNYRAWAQDVLRKLARGELVRNYRQGEMQVLGAVTPEIVAWLEREHAIRLHTAAISISDDRLVHIASKNEPAQQLSESAILDIATAIGQPKAILWDRQSKMDRGLNALIYVFELPGDPDHLAKVAVHLPDRSGFKGRIAGERVRQIAPNAVRTAGRVARETLLNPGLYELLAGNL